MAINWNKKISALKTWGAGLGALNLLTQIFQGNLFSGYESFAVNLLLAAILFLVPPLIVFAVYWPQKKNADSPAPPAASTPTTGWNKKNIWLVLLGIFIAYKIIMSLFIGHKKAELNDLMHQLQIQQGMER